MHLWVLAAIVGVSQPEPGCLRVALGPAAEPPPARVVTPAVLELRPGGRVAAARGPGAVLALADTSLAGWRRSAPDSIGAEWRGGWLGSAVEVRLARQGGAWRGRYVLLPHQVTDGRQLWRGDALAVQARCGAPGAADGQLARWRAGARPDTGAATAEALAEFRAFLRETPVHALSLMNYRLATYACRHGRLPATLAAVRPHGGGPLAALDAVAFLDAWGRPLRYTPRPPGYELRSAGPDGTFGTADDLVSALDTPLRRERADGCL